MEGGGFSVLGLGLTAPSFLFELQGITTLSLLGINPIISAPSGQLATYARWLSALRKRANPPRPSKAAALQGMGKVCFCDT